MTIHRLRTVFFAAVLVLAVFTPLQMLSVRGAAVATSLKFSGATTTKTAGIMALRATLTSADGKPVNKRTIDFYQQVQLMGTREAMIGSAETDSTGTATLSYHPAENGQQTIIVRFAGSDTFAASEGRGAITVAGAIPLYVPPSAPLATPAQWLPRILGMLIIATWLILFGVFFVTTRGVSRLGKKAAAGGLT